MADVKPGDEVSWNYGGGAPGGKAAEVKEDQVDMTTKRGNTVTKKGEEGNPAVYIEREGHDVVKKASELRVESEGPEHKGGEGEKAEEKTGGLDVPKKGRGRSKSPGKSPGPAAKKSAEPEKMAEPAKEPEKKAEKAEPKKKAGRPAGKTAGTKKADKPKRKADTETGEPRRSKRNKT